MTTYYMTSKRHSETNYWEACRSQTLAGAKREASRAYRGGYNDSQILIATGDGWSEERRIVAVKPSLQAKWR